MLGAIYGDKAGSIHEYGQIKTIKPVEVEQLIQENSFYMINQNNALYYHFSGFKTHTNHLKILLNE